MCNDCGPGKWSDTKGLLAKTPVSHAWRASTRSPRYQLRHLRRCPAGKYSGDKGQDSIDDWQKVQGWDSNEHRIVGLPIMLCWPISRRRGTEILQVLSVWEIFSWLLVILLVWSTDGLLQVFQCTALLLQAPVLPVQRVSIRFTMKCPTAIVAVWVNPRTAIGWKTGCPSCIPGKVAPKTASSLALTVWRAVSGV